MKVALLCGGTSLERGISLNSARSVLDHLESQDIEIVPIYFDFKRNAYKISKAQLYSNNPSDFDFKLRKTATSLKERSLVKLLKTVEIVFPAMHGSFGEDGTIQNFLEKHNIPFVGSGSQTCKKAFDKFLSNKIIQDQGFFSLPTEILKIYHNDHREIVKNFFEKHQVKRAVVKPAGGGSSIGVFSVTTVQEAIEKINLLFSKRMDTRVVIQPFARGIEFTVIILENKFALPVALPPTEIETDYTENQIFDFRKKYLPTRQVTWHCPPRFNNKVIEKIQAQAEQLFCLFGFRDFSRFDGWVFSDGNIWFADFNPISGMEQNSFLFQQASRVGMTHGDVLKHILNRAGDRYGIKFPVRKYPKTEKEAKKKIHIIMGGNTSERQVSLMSGTNVWLKLRKSAKYLPCPFLLDRKGGVWKLPYDLCLNHTVEEIIENCKNYRVAKKKLTEFEQRARVRLSLPEKKSSKEFFEPQKMTLEEFIKISKFVFIALHGGDGENGNMQKLLSQKRVKFNGPDEKVSRLCMDKWSTSVFIKKICIPGIHSIPGKVFKTQELVELKKYTGFKDFWKSLKEEIGGEALIVKPREDGCSTGIVRLSSSYDLEKYLDFIVKRSLSIPSQTFNGQLNIVEMPPEMPRELLLEKFIDIDVLKVKNNKFKYYQRSGWIEVTIGVIETNSGIKVFNPSITVAEGKVLTVEEKFQGGTGINITPPPGEIIKPKILGKVKKSIGELADKIGIKGYSRIDAFVNVESGEIMVIEINTLPGLTPSTVFYHQALGENPPIFPRKLLETLIENKKY